MYVGVLSTLYKSLDNGMTFKSVLTIPGAAQLQRIFCAASGDVFVSGTGATTPGLIRIHDGTPTQVLTIDEANTCIWSMDEDASGNLYVGEYSSNNAGKMRIWKSIDGGATWTQKYINDLGVGSQDHIHDLRVDPVSGYVYATVGDPTNDNIIRSVDGGENWVVIQAAGAQFVPITFLDGYVYVGTDNTSSNNKIYRFLDDGGAAVILEEVTSLPTAIDNPFYCGGSYNGKLFFGCSTEYHASSGLWEFDGSSWSSKYVANVTHAHISRHNYNGTFILSAGSGNGILYTP